jgi:hypothetical protein
LRPPVKEASLTSRIVMPIVSPPPSRRIRAVLRFLIGAGAVALTAFAAQAQVLTGKVRTLDAASPLPNVEIMVRDSVGRDLARVYSNEQGVFTVRLRERVAFSVHARRLGFQMADTDLLRIAEDTVRLEFQLAEVATEAAAVTVTGMPALNAQRLEDAQRRGWAVYAPELVAQHRSRARDLTELLRSLGPRHVQMPRNSRDCVRSMRNNQCVTYVLDGQVLGMDAYIFPEDVYFLAVLTPSESAVMYGNRAINGAVVVYTRLSGDRYDQDQLPPHLRRLERKPPEGR